MTDLENRPPKPEFGKFQTAFWDDAIDNWRVRDLTPEEIAQKFPAPPTPPGPTPEEKARSLRNYLLSQSDWTQVADAPVDQAVWAVYRQALRDVPQQSGFPNNIIWPTKPQ